MDKIYTSQNLCKYLYYDVKNPLSYADFSYTSILFTDADNKKIFTTPFSIDNADTQKSTLTINVSYSRVVPDNVYFKNVKVEVMSAASDLGEKPQIEDLIGAIRPLLKAYRDLKVVRVYLVHNNLINTLVQEPVFEQLLPLPQGESETFGALRASLMWSGAVNWW